jgi:hypothetical protein
MCRGGKQVSWNIFYQDGYLGSANNRHDELNVHVNDQQFTIPLPDESNIDGALVF